MKKLIILSFLMVSSVNLSGMEAFQKILKLFNPIPDTPPQIISDDERRINLHEAAKINDQAVQKVLDSIDLNEQNNAVNATDTDGNTPLHLAAACNNADAIPILVNAEAEVDAKNNEDKTPLQLAIENNHHNAVQALINAGANVAGELEEIRIFLNKKKCQCCTMQ